MFLALPMSLLIYVDAAKLQSEVRHELKQLKKLKAEVKEKNEKIVVDKPADAGGM